jgi:hypothetical protein
MSGFKAMNERPESGAPFRLGNVRNQGGIRAGAGR